MYNDLSKEGDLMHCYKKAFTLAEVLITLLIIGVVASLVVPALINDTQDAELHTAWKKAYSELDQTTRRIVLDNAGSLKGLCSNADNNCLRNLYEPFLSITKICINGTLNGNCWHNSYEWRFLNNIKVSGWGSSAGLILSNGNFIRFEATNNSFPDCTNTSWVNNIPKCARIDVDVNGFKGPNVLGKDVYSMVLTENRLLPVGITGDSTTDTCTSTGTGVGCAAKYLYQ
jgi:prepilin-type N-terminal cleavage/methylation domain-containing protein